MLYHFLRRLKATTPWYSATLYVGLFMIYGILGMLCGFVLLWEYFHGGGSLLLFARESYWLFIWLICVPPAAITIFYYNKYKDKEKIEENFQALSKRKRLTYKIIVWFLEIAIPVGAYCVLRIVIVGHIHV